MQQYIRALRSLPLTPRSLPFREHSTANMAPPQLPGFKLEWSDDFLGAKYTQPYSTNWDIRADNPLWDQQEVQLYTKSAENVCLSGSPEGSMLIIPVREINPDPAQFTMPDPKNPFWTSGRVEGNLTWNCNPKQKLIFQARIRTPGWDATKQKGIWPAFWTLGDFFKTTGRGDWPRCGEWDIMEKRGSWKTTVGSLHSGNQWNATVSAGGGTPGQPATTGPISDPGQYNTFAIQVDCTKPGEEQFTWIINGIPLPNPVTTLL